MPDPVAKPKSDDVATRRRRRLFRMSVLGMIGLAGVPQYLYALWFLSHSHSLSLRAALEIGAVTVVVNAAAGALLWWTAVRPLTQR